MYYFAHRVNREIKEIYWQTFLANLALALVFIFEPIYLYTLSHSLIHILWFYTMVYAWYMLLICFGAKFASLFGYKHSIFLSNIFYIIYWIVLYFIAAHSSFFYVAPLFFALQKSFFWPAFDADMSLNDLKDQRGRELGVLYSTQQAAFIIGPFLGGLISAYFGFLPLFILASALMFLSVLPLLQSPDIFDRHQFKFENLWQVIKTHWRNFFGYFGFAEDLMIMSLWPAYMFIVVPQLADVGAISAIAMLVTVMLILYIGKHADQIKKTFLIEKYSIFYSLTWLFRFLAVTPGLVWLFDSLTKVSKATVTVPVMALTFEHGGERGPDHAIAYSVFYEFSLAAGKVVTALLGVWLLTATGNIYLVFAMVGVLTLFYGLLK